MLRRISFVFIIFIIFVPLLIVVLSKQSNKQVWKTSGALDALDFWAVQRAYPDKVIPDDKYYAAYKYSKENLQSVYEKQSVAPWTTIGPHNIGGRTNAVIINPLNPNTIYAGSASGGLWRSYTGGVGASAWQQATIGFPVLGVNAIAMHPTDTNIIYIGTGEVYGYQNSIGGLSVRTTRGSYGIGALKTTNNGVTWTKIIDWSYNQKRGIQVIKLNPLNPNVVWAGTTEGTYKSYNGGLNWVVVNSTIMVTDILINPLDTNQVVIACGNLGSTGTGLYRTANGGSSWIKMTTGLPSSWGGKALYHYHKANPNILYVSIGVGTATGAGTYLCKSTDFGNSWATVSTTDYATYQGWYSHFVIVHPTNPNLVLTGGIDMYKSTNAGTTLTQKSNWSAWYFGRPPIGGPEGPSNYSHADHHAFDIHPTNPNVVYLATDGGIFRTTDFGETFSGCNGKYQTQQFYNGFSSANSDTLFSMGGFQDNASAIYDGQLAWIRIIGGDGCWTAINYQNNNIVYATSQNLSINRSTNKGANFSSLSVPSGGTVSFAAPYVVAVNNSNIMYAGKAVIFRSTNMGTSWTATNGGVQLDGNPAISMGISSTNENVVYAGMAPVSSSAKIFVTTNGGTNWTNVTGSLPDRYPVDITVDPQNHAIAYVAFSGYGTPHLYKTTNYGGSWVNIGSLLPDVPTSAVAIDPMLPNHIYVGNDIGVYLTTNNGANWIEFMTGMPEASIVMDLSIVPGNRKIRAATHGNGGYERPLFGNPSNVVNNNIMPDEYKLEQNYPNPFNSMTNIKFQMLNKGMVTVKVFDVVGREVAILVNKELEAGSYEVRFDAGGLTSGVYFYQMKAGGFTDTKSMVVLK